MSTATFIRSDTTTEGTWYNGSKALYGADGYGIIGNASSANNQGIPINQGYFSYPAYATVTIGTGASAWCWANSTASASAMEYAPPGTSNGSDSNRVEAAWYNATSFTIDIQDGSAHQIAVYVYGGPGTTVTQQIQITDDNNNNAVLDTRTVTDNGAGTWMVWIVAGKVTFTFAFRSGTAGSAQISGIFFDPAPRVFPPFVSRPSFEPAYYE